MAEEQWTLAGPRVRWRIVHDPEPYDASYIDTWEDLSEEEKADERKQVYAQVYRNGVWCFQIEVLKDVLCPHCKGVTHQTWGHENSCYSIIGWDEAKKQCAEFLRGMT